MVSLYWIEEALKGILPTLWMTFGVGLPWAYTILATKNWQSRMTVGAVALAIGPAWVTAWMLVLGVVGASINQPLFSSIWVLPGTIIIAGIGTGLAWHKRKQYTPKTTPSIPLAIDEKMIISLIIVAVIIRWVHTAFWTFTAYDALWVYGYQSRLYFLEGFIPNSIDYYPQFLQLQYTFVQVLIGEINDHAARMVIPMMHIGTILATYLLGKRLVNRRTGLFAAALWSLHPYVGQWSVIGDLEIPVTFSITMAAGFFLSAWMEKESVTAQRLDAIIAGLMLGIAMYTKPTAGGFIWGVVLLVVADLLRTRFNLQIWKPRFMVAFWTGIASIPLGAVWYLRNIALGHDAITFPPDLWLSLARRSGDHLNWIVLAIIVGFIIYGVFQKMPVRQFLIVILGIILLLTGVLSSNPIISPDRLDPPQSYITLIEGLFIGLGLIIIFFSLLPHIRKQFIYRPTHSAGVIGWSLLLALPYFATWFYSYSYHYRLGFAVVPLLILPTAVLLAKWLTNNRLDSWGRGLRFLYYLLLIILSIPGIFAVAVDITWSRVWLADESLDTDIRKYQVFNPSLMEMYFALNEYMEVNDEEIIILAPGEQRLHFFFPQIPILDELVGTLDEFESLGATHFIYGTQARWKYERNGIIPTHTQLISALGRKNLFQELKYHDDATFSYELYHYTNTRFDVPKADNFTNIYMDKEILFGDSIRLHASDIITPETISEGDDLYIKSAWQALRPIHQDYRIMIEFENPNLFKQDYYWITTIAPHSHGYYSTSQWDIREIVQTDHIGWIPKDTKHIRRYSAYQFRIYILDTINNRFLPVYVDGKHIGDFYRLEGDYRFGS